MPNLLRRTNLCQPRANCGETPGEACERLYRDAAAEGLDPEAGWLCEKQSTDESRFPVRVRSPPVRCNLRRVTQSNALGLDGSGNPEALQ